jgi:energy-coupling factor transporter ATP-binding protein EcfA2
MIREISIKNYKSILDHTIELGRINVFIGENGSGKSNILEAVATAAATASADLTVESLYSRGVRIAKPSITISSFLNTPQAQEIDIDIAFDSRGLGKLSRLTLTLSPADANDINTGWRVKSNPTMDVVPGELAESEKLSELTSTLDKLIEKHLGDIEAARDAKNLVHKARVILTEFVAPSLLELEAFCIYNVDPLALRGLHVVSRRVPLGIHGENLDVFLASFDRKQFDELLEHAKVISWLDRLVLDTQDELKFQGHKLGRSVSKLYFRDRFMRRKNNVFSAENANEGILHILFYLALFLSDKTPPFFGIDNIETALNPQLCRDLMKTIAKLAKEHDKQALITTHNPAILDGLNLHDDEQRLFVVYRNDQGHTETKRIKLKPDTGESKYKLSELWMRGHLGGLPKTF